MDLELTALHCFGEVYAGKIYNVVPTIYTTQPIVTVHQNIA